MKKFLMTLLLMVPMSTYALSVGVENDVTIGSNGSFLTVDGHEVTVGTGGISFTNSDTVRIGVDYSTSLIGGLSGGVSYDYTTGNDHVLGVDTSIEYWGANLDTTFAWNVNSTDFDATIGTGYNLFGLDGSVTTNWDVDDFSYEGLDVAAGYTWNVTDSFSVRPNVTLPLDSGFSRGDLTAGVSINLSFGSTPSE